MFELPASTLVNRFLPKDKFYKKTVMNSKLKQQFTDEIEKITWTHKLSPDTLNVTSDDKLQEIQIFEILLKDADISKATLKHIDSSIPYPIIYVLKRQTGAKAKVVTSIASFKKEYGMKSKNDDFVDSGWSQPSGQFILKGNTVTQIYVNYLAQIFGIYRRPFSDPKKEIEDYERRVEINKKIAAINKKMASEPSIAKKQELARERHALEEQLK